MNFPATCRSHHEQHDERVGHSDPSVVARDKADCVEVAQARGTIKVVDSGRCQERGMTFPCAPLLARHRDVLRLLVVGATREHVIQALHLSSRAVDAYIAQIKHALRTHRRFCLGVRAVRWGYVDCDDPIIYARRPGASWVEPTMRQLDVIRPLASGDSVEAAAGRIGMSASTVWRDLTRLATANGAVNMIHAGALFEALEWT